jgi:hypothetical protein
LRVELRAAASAVIVGVSTDPGLSRPPECRQPLQRLCVSEADDLIITFEDEPFVGDAEPGEYGQPSRPPPGLRFPN